MEQLIKETLQSCREYLPKLIAVVANTAGYIQSGNEAEGVCLMPSVFDGLQWVTDAIRGIQQNGFNLEIDLQSITERFKELEGALEIRDYVLIADIFEYEIGPTLEEWLKKIEQYRLQRSC